MKRFIDAGLDRPLPGRAPGLDRREFLRASAAGGLLLTISPSPASAADPAPSALPRAYLRIEPDNRIVFIAPRVEMGQGAYTSLAMLIAEELEVGLDQIAVEPAPPDAALYSDAINGEQATGTSATTISFYDPLRWAGANARTLLIEAAAHGWRVDPSTCRATRAVITHETSGRTVTYGAVAGAAAALPLPRTIVLKQPKDFTLIGTPAKRIDTAAKVDGTARFGIDVQLPGLKIATIAACPVFGGALGHVNDTKAMTIKGVRKIVRLHDAVAVVADHTGAARKGLAALDIAWNAGPNAGLSSADIVADLEKASARPGAVGTRTGDAAKALAGAARRVAATYRIPFLAHAPMEPMNCTAHVRDGRCDVWVGTQVPVRAREAAAKAAGLPPAMVTIHNQLIGGGFGRRLFTEHITQAVQIARACDGPVKLIWSREEDIRHDAYRPYYYDSLEAGLDENGKPVAWTHRVAGASVSARWDPTSIKDGLDTDALDSAAGAYDFPNVLLDYVRQDVPHMPVGWWRGVGPTHNVFVVESFIDELAHLAGQDPVAYRRALLGSAPRVRAVLDLAAEKSGWGAPLVSGRGRGVSALASFGSFVAQVAEVTVRPDGAVRVDRVVCAVDCGRIVNPDIVRAQIEGGIIFGITAALYGEITLDRGRVVQGNFDSYRMLRLGEAPAIEVHLIESDDAPGGIGEPGTATIAAAVTNAVFAATGQRLRTLPIDPAALKTG
jgi:isoquinoline 1-oxidoreductase beta subunit